MAAKSLKVTLFPSLLALSKNKCYLAGPKYTPFCSQTFWNYYSSRPIPYISKSLKICLSPSSWCLWLKKYIDCSIKSLKLRPSPTSPASLYSWDIQQIIAYILGFCLSIPNFSNYSFIYGGSSRSAWSPGAFSGRNFMKMSYNIKTF